MDAQKLVMFQNRLTKVYKHKVKHANRLGITCWRVYDHDLPEFPLIIDLYEQFVHLNVYLRRHGMTEDQHQDWLEQTIAVIVEVLGVDTDDVFTKERRRKANRLSQYQKTDEQGNFLMAEEGGLKFLINLTDYLDTGLFLDHRTTRSWVQQKAVGKHVLNLFCYTASFSVYAAAGQAASITSIDLSKTYLAWAQKNMELNKLYDPQKHFYIHADVKQHLATLPEKQYDLVILDPPTFSNSKRMNDILDIQLDHVTLINQVVRAMKPGGTLYFSTNYTKFVLEAEQLHVSTIKDVTKASTPFDFEGKLKRWCYKMTV
ncbi:MAG: methyltransferase domain-containing protein [Bacteroidetes bacterium]|nr:MAG: methyltransferase domain-containing protein [Bacteroidota bacterium]